MSYEEQGSPSQPFDFLNATALAMALDETVPELSVINRFLESSYLDDQIVPELRENLYHLTVRNALSLIERASLGVLPAREQPTLLKYLINANMIFRHQPHADEFYLVQLMYGLERLLLTRMACNFTRC